MKLVYLANTGIPSRAANSIHIMKMCQALAANGHAVTLVIPTRRDTERGVRDVYGFYGVAPLFRVVRVPLLPIGGPGYVYGLLAALIAKARRPDLAYGRDLKACALAGRLGLPVMIEFHRPLSTFPRWEQALVLRLAATPACRRLVVNTDALRRTTLAQYPVFQDRILAAQNGADPVPAGVVPAELPNRGGRLQVGYVGQLYPAKGMDLIATLVPLCPWADFHVVGGMEREQQHWRERLGALPNLTFHGFLPPGELHPLRQAFDMVLAPYAREKRQPDGVLKPVEHVSPVKVFEYMAAGKAMICSDLPVFHEVVEPEVTALLCDPDQPAAWATALARLRDQPELRQRLGSAAKARFLKEFTWQARAAKVVAGL